MIPDDVVDEVRMRADLVEVIGEVVPLKKSGREWKGKCPFHEDKTPSFYVIPQKGFYNCFGCGESGDIFTFVMKRMGMDFTDAIRYLGGRYGVEIREVKGRGEGEEDPFRPHYEANAFAREFFRERLTDPEGGARAREYLTGRGIDTATAERYGLGFAPDAWRDFREAASHHGISDELLLEVGLLTTSEKSKEPYDRFRNRIIFPIEGLHGRVVAFGGRVLAGEGKGVPKYLNSPESPIYHKGQTLYALGWNRNEIRKEEAALIVEGYMDVVALGAGGVNHAVATLGTAMTEEQARLLGRYTARALLLFDSDPAGLRASFKAGNTLLSEGVHPAVVTLPPGEDPDTLIRKEGADGLRRYLDGAVDILDRKLQLLDEHGYFDSIDRTRTAVDKLLPTLRAVKDPTLRDIYVSKVAERTGVRRLTLEEELRARATPPVRAPQPLPRKERSPRLEGMGPERQLLLVLLKVRGWVERAAERIGPGEFRDPVHRAIFEALMDEPELDLLPDGMPSEVVRRFEDLLGDSEVLEHTGRVFEESVERLLAEGRAERRAALRVRLREPGTQEEKNALLREMEALGREGMGRWNVTRRESPAGSNPNDRQGRG